MVPVSVLMAPEHVLHTSLSTARFHVWVAR